MPHNLRLTLAAGLLLAAVPAWALSPNAPTNFGGGAAGSGFGTIDIHLFAGGPVSAQNEVPGDCPGYVSDAPDFAFEYPVPAPFYISVDATADTTLVVLDPGGTWWCNDDTNGINPFMLMAGPSPGAAPPAGKYLIWVGTFAPMNSQPALLRIFEPGL